MEIEKTLNKYHQHSYCTLVGNASTGLVIALKALGLKGKHIAIPNSVCPHVPIAIFLSGNKPYYIDISMKTLGMDINDLIQKSKDIDAVIAVHAYGSICNIVEIAEHCKIYNLPLIEDLAVAEGATVNGQPVGSFSDLAVVSFGTGKIIDVNHGGAIFTSNTYLAEEISGYVNELNPQREESKKTIEEFGEYHTRLYNERYLKGTISSYSCTFKHNAISTGKLMLCKFDDNYRPIIQRCLDGLSKIITCRRENYAKLEDLLASEESDLMSIYHPPTGSVPWRFNILIENRNVLLRKILNKRIKVSSWFPSVDEFFKDRELSGVRSPNSDFLGNMVLNFWIDESIDNEYFEVIASDLRNHLNLLEANYG